MCLTGLIQDLSQLTLFHRYGRISNLWHFHLFDYYLEYILQKIKTETATGVIIAPFWKTQTFFPILMRMLIDYPVLLSARKDLLTLPSHPEMRHNLDGRLRLMICLISGDDTRGKAFRRSYRNAHGVVEIRY